MSVLNSITFLTSTITYILYPFLFKLNPKVSLNLAKVGLASSILLFCYGPFWALFVGRTLMGFFAEFCHVVAHWMIYQIALPQHKELVFACVIVFQSGVALTLTFLSYANNGGFWMWRIVNSVPALLLIALVFIDLDFLKKVNGLDYLLSTKTKEQVLKQLSTYYKKSTSRKILKQFIKGKEAKGKAESGGQSLAKTSLWVKIKVNRAEIVNSTLVAFLGVGSFCDVFFYNGIYIGSHLLSNQEEVKASKQILFLGGIAFFVASVLLMVFKFNKKRKA